MTQFLLATTAIIALTSSALAGAELGPERFIQSETRCSPASMNLLARPVADMSSVLHPGLPSGYQGDFESLRKKAELLDRSQSIERFFTVGLPGHVIKFAADFIPGVGYAIQTGIDGAIEVFDNNQRQVAMQSFRRGLLELEADPSNFKAFMDEQDGNARLAFVEQQLAKLGDLNADEALFDNISDPALRDEVQQSAIRMLTRGLAVLTDQVKRNSKQLKKFTGEDLKSIRAELKKNRKLLIDAKAEIAAQQKKVQNVVDGQKEAVKGSSGEPAQGEEWIASERAEAVRRKQVGDFIARTKRVTEQLDAASGILHELGAPEAARAVGFVSGSTKLMQGIALSSVNPAAILPTVLNGVKFLKGFFGSSSKDPLGEALNQIIKTQRQILGRLADIDRMLRNQHAQTMEGIDAVNANTILIYDLLREQRQDSFDHCWPLLKSEAFFDPQNSKEQQLGFFIRDRADVRWSSYEEFSTAALAAAQDQAIGPCKKAIREVFIPNDQKIANAFLEDEVELGPSAGTARVKREKERVVAHRLLTERTTRLAMTVLTEDRKTDLVRISLTSSGLAAKAQGEQNSSLNTDESYRSRFRDTIGSPLSHRWVRKYVSVLLGTYPYIELSNSSGALPYRRVVKKGPRPRMTKLAVGYLSEAAFVLDVALAQEAVRMGDLVLPLAHRLLVEQNPLKALCDPWPLSKLYDFDKLCALQDEEKGSQQVDVRTNLVRRTLFGDEVSLEECEALDTVELPVDGECGLIHYNRQFARNLGAYIAHTELSERGNSSLAYEVSYASRHPSLLKRVLGDNWVFNHVSAEEANPSQGLREGWHVVVNKRRIPLPTPEELYSGRYVTQPSTLALVNLRRRIGAEIAGYEVITSVGDDGLTSQQARRMRELMAFGASPF